MCERVLPQCSICICKQLSATSSHGILQYSRALNTNCSDIYFYLGYYQTALTDTTLVCDEPGEFSVTLGTMSSDDDSGSSGDMLSVGDMSSNPAVVLVPDVKVCEGVVYIIDKLFDVCGKFVQYDDDHFQRIVVVLY